MNLSQNNIHSMNRLPITKLHFPGNKKPNLEQLLPAIQPHLPLLMYNRASGKLILSLIQKSRPTFRIKPQKWQHMIHPASRMLIFQGTRQRMEIICFRSIISTNRLLSPIPKITRFCSRSLTSTCLIALKWC